MRTLPAGMQAHLDTGSTTLCWCWRVTRNDATKLGFTDHDRDLVFDGTTFKHFTGFSASEVTSSLGLSVDNLDVEGALSSVEITERDLEAGLFDDAEIEVWRVNWASPAQRILVRKGNIGEVERDDTGFRAELRGLAHRTQIERGRIFSPTCDAALGDSRCGVDLSAGHTGTGAVTATVTSTSFEVSGINSFASGYFSRGKITWTGGDNAGLAHDVRLHSRGGGIVTIDLWMATPYPIAVADAFTITAGCDKRFATCRNRFDNHLNFRGFPHMPGNDAVVRYANPGQEGTDGSTRQGEF